MKQKRFLQTTEMPGLFLQTPEPHIIMTRRGRGFLLERFKNMLKSEMLNLYNRFHCPLRQGNQASMVVCIYETFPVTIILTPSVIVRTTGIGTTWQ